MLKLFTIIIGIILFVISFIFKTPIIIYILYIILSYNLFINIFKNIKNKVFIDENLLMIIATIGALFIKEYHEAIAVLLLYQIGEFLSDLSTYKSRKNIIDLLDLKSEIVHLKDEDINPSNVKIGDIMYVKTGEKIPLDGIIKSGTANLDMKSLTGEAKLYHVKENDKVISGSINTDGYLEIEVLKTLEESTTTKIMKLIEQSNLTKTYSEKFITKFAKIYTPIVVFIAFLLTFIPFLLNMPITPWLHRSLVFLVVSCPCALVISVPLSYFCAVGQCSKMGLLVKGATYLEQLSDIKAIALDKTGTITEGIFEVDKIIPYKISEQELLSYAAYAENNSNHPIALAIKKKYNKQIDNSYIKDYKEQAGMGIKVLINDEEILIGNGKLLDKYKVNYPKVEFLGATVLVAKDNEYIGTIVISDKVKQECLNITSILKKNGFEKVIMLSGDDEDIVKKLAKKLKFDEAYGSLLPEDKVNILNSLMKEQNLIFIGDGINDSLVLLNASIGVSMGNIGSDVAIEASDIVIMDDNPTKIVDAYNISKKTKRIVKMNIYIATITKFICLLLGVFGLTNMWIAVLADVGITLITILNSFRIYKI